MQATSNYETQKTILAGIFFTLLLVLVSSNIPLVGFLAALFVPLPILFYRTRLNRKNAAMILVAILLFIIFIDNGISASAFFFGGLMLLGFLLSESFLMNFSIERTILFSCGGILTIGCFILFFYSTISTTDLFEITSNYLGKVITLTLEFYKEKGVPEEILSEISKSKNRLIYEFTRIFPSVVVSITIITAWINILVAGTIFIKHDIVFANFGTLTLWKAPERLVMVTIICGIAMLIPVEILNVISLNFFRILMLIYFLQGIAITAFYFDKKNFHNGLRVFLYGLIVILPMLKLFVIGIGFFDMWVNFRKTGIDKTGTLND